MIDVTVHRHHHPCDCCSCSTTAEYYSHCACTHTDAFVKLEFHGTDTDTDTDTDILADFRARIVARMSACPETSVQLATSRTRTMILADLSSDLSDTRAYPREDVR